MLSHLNIHPSLQIVSSVVIYAKTATKDNPGNMLPSLSKVLAEVNAILLLTFVLNLEFSDPETHLKQTRF